MTDNCPWCGEEFWEGDRIVGFRSYYKGEGNYDYQKYHAGCFMDIVNLERVHASRSSIETGQISKSMYDAED